jgi:IS30 family transposase
VNANGGRDAYRAVDAEASVRERVKRPRKRRLECDQRLRKVIEAGLEELWSPTQISNTLRLDYPTDQAMRVSPETIYEALYRGVVDRKPQSCLRTKRGRRVHRHRRRATGPGVIKNRLMIKDRPAHIEDRLEVGHWEGDLIIGNHSTALATLVERMTRYTVLVQLPGKRTRASIRWRIRWFGR